MPEFEEYVRSAERGYQLSWQELTEFAAGLLQTLECLIVGADELARIAFKDIEERGFEGCRAVIQAFDSTEWRVGLIAELRLQ